MPTWSTGRTRTSETGGFTLFELLVVLAILATFSTVLSVRLGGGPADGDLKRAIRVVTAEIRYTRGKAARSHEDHVLRFDLERNALLAQAGAKPEDDEASEASEWQDPFESGPADRWTQLPEGVEVKGLVVAGRGRFLEGEAGIRFFANGCTEQSLIHLEDRDGEVMTLEIKPLTVQVKVHAGYVDQDI